MTKLTVYDTMITTTAKGLKLMNNYNFNVEHMGNKIKLARVKAGLTQEQLAEKAGTTKTTIVAVEKGEKQSGGNIMLIANIAAVLNLSLDEICGINTKPVEETEQDEKNKILNALKVIFDLKGATHSISASDFPSDTANLNITINDTGLAYFAQEYSKAVAMIETNKNTEYYEDVKSAIMNAFECRFANLKKDVFEYSFDDKIFILKGEDKEHITISLGEIPKSDDDLIPF